MTAKECYQAGRLKEAIEKTTEDIKADPADQRARVFMFELLCFSGDLSRAQKQLDAITASEVDAEIAVARYRNLLSAEVIRREVFSGRARPHIQEPVPDYAASYVEAVKQVAEGNSENAIRLLEKAQESVPNQEALVNGECCDGFGDGDDVLRPFLEATIEGAYCWVPWQSIRSLSLIPPKYLRDLFWMPARLELENGRVGETYLPVLYAGSHLSTDDQIRLGRVSEWRTDRPGLSLGIGQRIFVAGDADRAMLDISELEFNHGDPGDSTR